MIELSTDKYDFPDERLEAALEELGIPVEKHDLFEAESGVNGVE
jgi:hypothetical protein